ncbi:MAG: UDP-N-acetylmuramate dehydrogenase [Candidatus Riflebacteria bacterium]|nr:UDP-N-acetylmuramate dehydrogenase [Candidatus Riflebacteria bacterium]
MPEAVRRALVNRIERDIPLSKFTTFFLGGPAELFLEVHTEEELIEAIRIALEEKTPYFLLGGGSNLVVSDHGIRGLVIRNRSGNPDKVDKEKCLLTVSSGRPLSHFVGLAWRNVFTGAESFTGIPGTVGGAIYGNAGAYGKSMSDLLVSALVLSPDGSLKNVGKEFFEFGYRQSKLKREPAHIINATFQLEKGERSQIQAKIKEISSQRHSKHPPRAIGSAGSFFQNLDPAPGETRRRAAGEVLEKAGAKGLSVGGASVYEKHANFIVNHGEATSKEVKELAQILKEKVANLFGITLKEEVLYIGG